MSIIRELRRIQVMAEQARCRVKSFNLTDAQALALAYEMEPIAGEFGDIVLPYTVHEMIKAGNCRLFTIPVHVR